MAIPDTVWVGQQATYQVGVFLSDEIRGRLRRNPVFVPPELRSMLAYDLASLNSVPRYAGSRRYEVHVFQRALFPLTAGRHEIPPARLEYALPLSNSFFAREESHSARTQSLVVIAREPPSTGRPPEYKGAVGRLALQTKLDRRSQRTGDPFTYTVVVQGTGNVSLLPRPDLKVEWADVVPGAVRVQMDSSTTLVRGRKEFDWILTPVTPGRQAVPQIRYPFFNPYSEQYEIAVGRSDSVTISGNAVVADRAAADTTPILAVRRTYEGQVPAPITDSTLFWVLMALVPLPLLFVSVGRRPRPVQATPPEAQLRDAMRDGTASPALVRRIFARAVSARTNLTAVEMTDEQAMRRALRRAGVSQQTASDAAEFLIALDASVFGGLEETQSVNHERALSLLRSIDQEARSPAAIAASRRNRQTIGVGLVAILSATAWAAQHDVVASTVFANGLAAYDAREFGSARQAFFELAQARPRAPNAWFNFGAASWQLDDTAAAVIGWQRAMRLDPASNDARELLRLGPGTPRLWHGVPPVTVTTLAIVGASFWLSGFVLMTIGRRRRHPLIQRIGGTLAIAAGIVLVAGIRQNDVIDGRDAGVVLSSARLRAMPVLSSEAGIEAQPGEVVRVLGQQGAWMNVELSDKRHGWVEAQRVQTLQQAEVTFSIAK
jgi:tetratricopeptide (TPR) repeat protein